MRLCVVQLATTWGRPHAVLARVDALLASGPPTDLVLLPETALTGYASPAFDFDLTRFAEPLDGPTSRALAGLAVRYQTTLVGPLILGREGRVYNATFAVGPDGGTRFLYEKRHPWFPETWATAGSKLPPVIEVAGVRTTVAVCFDVQFVDDDPQDALDAADLLLFPSSWVDDEDSRLPLLTQLAPRFGLWIANANWAAGELRIPGQGDSCIVTAGGEIQARLATGDGRLDALIPARSR